METAPTCRPLLRRRALSRLPLHISGSGHQIPLAPSQYWTSCFAWSFSALGPQIPLDGFYVPITVVSEKRLGFGVSLSSNIAQRFSEAIVAVFRQRFDAEESILFGHILDPSSGVCLTHNLRDSLTMDSATGWTDVCRWIDTRRRVSHATGRNQLRRYSVHIYTDDPVFSVVGQEPLLRALRIWHDVTSSFGLRMAIARPSTVGGRLGSWRPRPAWATSGLHRHRRPAWAIGSRHGQSAARIGIGGPHVGASVPTFLLLFVEAVKEHRPWYFNPNVSA